MRDNRAGVALILCAPSGTGKTTLVRMLKAEFPKLSFSVSYTTRAPRGSEVHGRDYFFVSKQEFQALAEKNFFAEWAMVHDNCYGTPRQKTIDILGQGQDIIFDVDVQGAKNLKAGLPTTVSVFVFPPTLNELKRRLDFRATDQPDVLERRLANARKEILEARHFDYWIVNDHLDTAYCELRSIFVAEKCRIARWTDLPDMLLNQGITHG
jgi:guanylate kinase